MNLRDLTGNAPLTSSARAAMSVADAIQKEPHKGSQLIGLAAVFLISAEAADITVPDLLGIARNTINHAEGRRPEFAAVTEYIEREVLSG